MVTKVVRRRDDGSVLVLTLVLVVVLAVIVLALAGFVTVGLKTSNVASERSASNADAGNVMNWAIERFAKKQLRPDDSCGEAPTYTSISVPAGLNVNGSTTTLECAQTNPITGEPVVHLIAASTGVQSRTIEATVEVPRYVHGARVSDWRVDIPIAVPAYVTTVPSGSTTTTTTTTTLINQPPIANATSWSVNPSTTSTLTLNASDADGTITSVNFVGVPANLTLAYVGGNSVQVTADATTGPFSGMSYTVTDDGGATSASALLDITVSSATTTTTTSTTSTTTTTLAPQSSCTFLVTSAHQNGKSGSGQLTVSADNSTPFTGWQLDLTQVNPSRPWSFFSWSNLVSATVGSTTVTASGPHTVSQGSPMTATAQLSQGSGAGTIVVGTTLPCSVTTP